MPSIDDPRPADEILTTQVATALARFEISPDTHWWFIGTLRPIDRHRLPALGWARGARIRAFPLQFPLSPAWHGYTFTVFGVSLPRPPAATGADGPRYLRIDLPNVGHHTVRVVQMTVQYDNDPLFVEKVWHSTRETEPAIRGMRPGLPAEVWQRVGVAHDLLLQLDRHLSGRRDDTGDYRADEGSQFMAALRPVAVQLVRSGEALNVTSIAASWGKSRKWVRKYRDLFKINFATLDAEIHEELGL